MRRFSVTAKGASPTGRLVWATPMAGGSRLSEMVFSAAEMDSRLELLVVPESSLVSRCQFVAEGVSEITGIVAAHPGTVIEHSDLRLNGIGSVIGIQSGNSISIRDSRIELTAQFVQGISAGDKFHARNVEVQVVGYGGGIRAHGSGTSIVSSRISVVGEGAGVLVSNPGDSGELDRRLVIQGTSIDVAHPSGLGVGISTSWPAGLIVAIDASQIQASTAIALVDHTIPEHATFRVGASMLQGIVDAPGAICVHAYDGAYFPLERDCTRAAMP
ncbi:hypothetical protein [Vulgatibacter incomptus]|uniref:hypothetical protein n=1 Tax=Vulgatibacter incomptus TaxID=1391653 RepID=UPI001F0ABE56|nr:hypothetical protein [Vulgatibacter incomptus]